MNRRKLSLRWFGSLTNLSTHRPTEKTNVKAAPEHHGSLGEAKQSVDDMDACLRSPGYAHSSQMYTHVGTVPRSQSQKKSSRGLKKKKKKEEEEEEKEEEEEERSRRRAGEHVRDSPLLSALSSLRLTSLDRTLPGAAPARPPPTNTTATPPGPASPLTSAHGSPFDEPPADPFKRSGGALEREPVNMATSGPRAASSQDLYVPMDPIAEAARRQTQEMKAVSGWQEAEPEDSQQDVTDSTGEYVKFSKEQFWIEPPSDKLSKQLEEELKLSSSNLKSHAWYHGRVPWKVSESLVLNHGDFLIRDSQSSLGDFVLTVRWEQKTLHFVVTTTAAVRSSETDPRVRYGLEAEAFDSLPDLVRFFVGSGAALSRWSAARILRPVNRTLPLGYLETAFGAAVSPPSCRRGLKDGSEEEVRPRSPSSLHQREPDVNTELSAGESSLSALHNTGAAPSPSGTLRRRGPSREAPPPDDPGSCYTELQPGPRSYVGRLRAEDGSARVEGGSAYQSPVVETASSFTPSRYRSPLMPADNRPLEVGVLRRVKELLAEVDPRTAARHITKADCRVARILEVTPEAQRMMGVSSGMELLTLPHGQQLRLDLLERFHTMATTLAVDVLGCTGTTEERAGLLHKIIQIAAELKGTTGDLFGFAAVMRALELPQVSRLEQTWTALRQRHTEGAILYEKTLRPFMKSLNDGTESCPLAGTTFPHVLPLLGLLEKSAAVGEGAEPWETAEVGVDVVMFHLGAARTIAQLGGVYRSNAESKLQGFQEQPEVLELFLTDFQMRLLWGSRGAEESRALRHAKFDQVLTALSNRLEPPVRPR
ncbi:sh2d3c [Pungitius sinensis]